MLKLVPIALLAGLLALPAGAQSTASREEQIEVHVRKDGHRVHVRIEVSVDASQDEAWAVLTDYDGMAAFVPTLKSSVVTRRDGNHLEVRQEGTATYGPFSFPFANIRRVELKPQREIRSRIVSGDLAPGEVITTIEQTGSGTHVSVSGTYAPTIWVPPVVGPAIIEAETRVQWQILRREILHRRALRG